MMSGTSLDGLDLALCDFERKGDFWSYRLIRAGYQNYSPELRTELATAISLGAPELMELDARYGAWLGKQAIDFLGTEAASLDAIASHGHTVHHRPHMGFTFQLGSPQNIALSSGLPAIGDFRSGDIALGGQGAPLVPIGDRLLFGRYPYCLNLGGISNISFERDGERVAFDIGIANMLLNHLVKPLDLHYDAEGSLARSGQINEGYLQALDALPYYKKPYPKSTGYEWFEETIIPLTRNFPDKPENLLRTAVQHIANQIAIQIHKVGKGAPGEVLVTGGGALNVFLIELLRDQLDPNFQVVIPDRELIDYKEAIVFGFLGALRLCNQHNVLASVTGASRNSCSGILCLP